MTFDETDRHLMIAVERIIESCSRCYILEDCETHAEEHCNSNDDKCLIRQTRFAYRDWLRAHHPDSDAYPDEPLRSCKHCGAQVDYYEEDKEFQRNACEACGHWVCEDCSVEHHFMTEENWEMTDRYCIECARAGEMDGGGTDTDIVDLPRTYYCGAGGQGGAAHPASESTEEQS